MDDSSVNSSVVLDIGNQEEIEDQGKYSIDFDGVEPLKDYVIDKIFCGENITVYALFEITDVPDLQKSPEPIVEMSETTKTRKYCQSNAYKRKISDRQLESKFEESTEYTLDRKKSYNNSGYSLKNFKGYYDLCSRDEDVKDMKVLYRKDVFSKQQTTSGNFKFVSKGVNTDIAQTPKLLDDLQRAVVSNLPFFRGDRKCLNLTSFCAKKTSLDIFESETIASSSTFNSESEFVYNRTHTPNFFLVPVLMMEDDITDLAIRDEIKASDEKKTKEFFPERVSFGINTESKYLITPTRKDLIKNDETIKEKEREIKNETKLITIVRNSDEDKVKFTQNSVCQKETNIKSGVVSLEAVQIQKSEKIETIQSSEKTVMQKIELKASRKENILDEIKFLQGKLSALIKSLEESDLDFANNKEMGDVLYPGQILHSYNRPERDGAEKQELFDFSQKTPINVTELSTSSHLISQFTNVRAPKRTANYAEPVTEASFLSTRSSTSTLSISKMRSSTTHEIYEEVLSRHDSQNTHTNLNINWENSSKNRRVIGISKSQSTTRCIFPGSKYTCFHGLRKSLSLEIKEDKMDPGKRMKSVGLKLEGGKIKQTTRIIQNVENVLASRLNCEMGDDIAIIPKVEKIDEFNVERCMQKSNESCKRLKQNNFNGNGKTFNEEEGDAKISYQKQTLKSSTDKLTLHYRNTNLMSSDEMIKSPKLKEAKDLNHIKDARDAKEGKEVKEKSVVEKNVEKKQKITNESEKSNNVCKVQRRSMGDGVGNAKKDAKNVKKIEIVKTTEKTSKLEKKEINLESNRPKSVSGPRKTLMKDSAESKLRVDKMSNSFKTKDSASYRSQFQRRDNHESKEKVMTVCQKISNEYSKGGDDRLNEERIGNDEKLDSDYQKPTQVSNAPVLFELLASKPQDIDALRVTTEEVCLWQDVELGNVSLPVEHSFLSNDIEEKEKKPIVKSVWALTKVFLYEDGTKKFQILEASSNFPECPLKNEPVLDDKSR